jgi:hypothetical protein
MITKISNRVKLVRRFFATLLLNGVVNEFFLNRVNLLKNRELTANLKEKQIENLGIKTTGTSITDSKPYLDYSNLCESALYDEDTFEFFRSFEIYRDVLEHVPHFVAATYAAELRKSPNREELKNLMRIIDSVGSPWKFNYKYFGQVSPTAMRYVHFANEISRLFPGINPQHICEIGCGFGGQAIALKKTFDFKKVTFVDLPSVLSLTKKSISTSKVEMQSNFMHPDESNSAVFDFLISNYAFSELSREYQDLYLKNYVSKSKAGFMAWNPLSFENLDGYSLSELLDLIPYSKAQREVPSTYPGNHYIYWNSTTN